jgi:hypothetical protein
MRPPKMDTALSHRGLSSSNPILITRLANLSVREIYLKHIFR